MNTLNGAVDPAVSWNIRAIHSWGHCPPTGNVLTFGPTSRDFFFRNPNSAQGVTNYNMHVTPDILEPISLSSKFPKQHDITKQSQVGHKNHRTIRNLGMSWTCSDLPLTRRGVKLKQCLPNSLLCSVSKYLLSPINPVPIIGLLNIR